MVANGYCSSLKMPLLASRSVVYYFFKTVVLRVAFLALLIEPYQNLNFHTIRM